MELRIDDFKRVLQSPARPTLFMVQLNFPNGDNSDKDAFFCKGAQLPSSDTGMIELSYMGRKAKYAGDRVFSRYVLLQLF